MDDFRSRLIDESMELKERLTKLKSFLNGKQIRNLQSRDQKLLRMQREAMVKYDDILEERLART